MGVPVIFSDKFQQLFEFVFLDRMVDIPVVQQRQVLTVFFSVLVQFLDKVVVPVVVQRQGYGQTVQKTVLAPQLQFIEGRRPPFVLQRQIPMVLPVQKTMETPQLQSVRWSMSLCAGRAMPFVVLTGAHGSDTAENCGGAAVAARRFFFLDQVVDSPVQDHRNSPVAVH